VAIAPLLVIWFGRMFSKTLICALIVFFPVLVNTMVGLRGRAGEPARHDALAKSHAPANVALFGNAFGVARLSGGLRIGATLSVIGAVVGEFVGSDRGWGS